MGKTVPITKGKGAITPETKWYRYHQNNSGGSFRYDGGRGLSVNVYVEATSPSHADSRMESLGVTFGDYDSCSCCGDRWSEADSWSEVEAGELPEAEEVLVKDDNKKGHFVTKWLPQGDYETFVHPLEGEFYGAHRELKHITRYITGYGMSYDSRSCGEIIEVGDDGWDTSGNFHAPAPQAKSYDSRRKLVTTTKHLRIEEGFGGLYYVAWASDRGTLETLQERVRAYLGALPPFDAKALAKGL